MYTLRLLGGFALEDAGAKNVLHLPQRRAEALLALLALSGGLGCTRDRLIALLWPERDTRHARHNLRDALHAARNALGREAIEGVGDVLRLDPAHVTSDVEAFEVALSAGRPADALAAYRGPLLDGFHLNDAPEFERWLDEERARLLRECLAATRRLAEAAEVEEDWSGAARWWGRSVSLDPYNSLAVAGRIEALARQGDRANAVKEGEAHCELLRADLELEPDPSFVQELQDIRNGDVASPHVHSVPTPADREAEPSPPPIAPRSGPGAPASDVPAEGAPGEVPRLLPGTRAGPRRRRWAGWAAALLVPAAVAALGLAKWIGVPEAAIPSVLNPVKVTTSLGVEGAPSWSPDGRDLAFQSDRSGNWDVWVTELGTGEAIDRTPEGSTDDLGPAWSPDGRWIAFFSARDGGGYFVMPRVGGVARKLAAWPAADLYPTPPAWSPAGVEIAYALGQRYTPWIEIRSVATGETRRLVLPERARNNVVADIAWSPDGQWLAYWRAISALSATSELWLTDVSSGASVRLTDGSHLDASPTWSPDSRRLYFVSDRGGTFDLWRYTLDAEGRPLGPPRQVTSGVEMTHADLSADGRQLAYAKARTVRNVFRAPILRDRLATWADVTQLTFEEVNYESVDVSRDGRLLLSSDRTGNWDIYLMPAEGGDLLPFVMDAAVDAGPRWTSDASEVAFYSSRSGHRELWVKPLGGGPARQVTRGESEMLYPTWSPDGLEIAAQDEQGISVVDVASGASRRLTRLPAGTYNGKPDWSPDGRWIAFTTNLDGEFGVWRVPAAGGDPEPMTEAVGSLPAVPRWSPDGKSIYFLRRGEDGENVWALDVENRGEWPVTALTGRRGGLGRFTLATDGRFVYFTWEESRADIWVADLLPGSESSGAR